MTHGEKWIRNAVARFHKYGAARGWIVGNPWKRGLHQYEILVRDHLSAEFMLAFTMHAEQCTLDAAGDEDVSAVLFDDLATQAGLTKRAPVDKRQLVLNIA